MTKTAVICVPRLEPHRPPPGPAIICNVCQQQGHQVRAYDLNIEFFHACRAAGVDYFNFDSIWNQYSDPDPVQRQFLDEFIGAWCRRISQRGYDYILVSVFGASCKFFTTDFLRELRAQTTAQIVVGGSAVNTFSLVDRRRCYGHELREQGLVDHYITGEGEKALIWLFQGQEGPGVNNTEPAQIDDLDSLPLPDYSFFDLDRYDYLIPGEREVYITGSRGCVRKCTYCDVERFWPKFRYRSGQSIADEIIKNYEQFGITRFYFTDSLVNGSLKSFNDQCDKLARYRFDHPIKWSGQFIFRDRRSLPRDHYRMISEAGGYLFFVGLESGSDRVRFDMGKKFTNDDIEHQLEECSRYGIKIMPLMFSGYVTETLEDHRQTLAMFPRWQRFVVDGTIDGIELGSILAILPGSPLERMIPELGLEFGADHGEAQIKLWQSTVNPDLTVRERIRRQIEIHETAMQYAWPVWRQTSRLNDLKQFVLKNRLHQSTPKFFKIAQIDSQAGSDQPQMQE